MISMGLKIISPTVFYPSAVIVCAIISGSIGSSYTTVGTIGVGLVGVAAGLGLPLGPPVRDGEVYRREFTRGSVEMVMGSGNYPVPFTYEIRDARGDLLQMLEPPYAYP